MTLVLINITSQTCNIIAIADFLFTSSVVIILNIWYFTMEKKIDKTVWLVSVSVRLCYIKDFLKVYYSSK